MALPPALEVAAKAPVSPGRAQELLGGLSAEARALMPKEVLAELEAAAARAVEEAVGTTTGIRRRRAGLPLSMGSLPAVGVQPGPPATRPSLPAVGLTPRAAAGDRRAAAMPEEPGLDSGRFPELDSGRYQPLESGRGPLPADHRPPLADPPSHRRVDSGRFPQLDGAAIEALASGAFDPVPRPSAVARSAGASPDGFEEVLSSAEFEPVPADAFEPLDGDDFEPISSTALAPLTDSFPSIRAESSAVEDDHAGARAWIAHELSRGTGPFGPRGAASRLVLHPEPSYRANNQWLRHRLSSTLQLDLYTAVQALQRDVPTFLAAFDAPDEAEAARLHLVEGGLDVDRVDLSDFGPDRVPDVVTRVSASADRVRFETEAGAQLVVDRAAFTWAALGEIDPDVVPRAVLAERTARGRRPAPSTPFDAAGGPYLALDLFCADVPAPLRIRSDRFDFSCLPDRALAAAVNMRRLLTWVAAPDGDPIPLDFDFRRVAHLPKPAREGVGAALPQRELEFTEYTWLRDRRRRRP